MGEVTKTAKWLLLSMVLLELEVQGFPLLHGLGLRINFQELVSFCQDQHCSVRY